MGVTEDSVEYIQCDTSFFRQTFVYSYSSPKIWKGESDSHCICPLQLTVLLSICLVESDCNRRERRSREKNRKMPAAFLRENSLFLLLAKSVNNSPLITGQVHNVQLL